MKHEKTLALLEALQLPNDSNIKVDGNYYTLNARNEKFGMSEAQYKTLKSFLHITFGNTNLKMDLLEVGFDFYHTKDSKELIYKKMKLLYEKKKDQLNKNGYDSDFQRLEEQIKKENIYIENVFFHIVYTSHTLPNYREAFQGLEYRDLREEREINDGEYIILSEKEREKEAKRYLNSYIEDLDSEEKVKILEKYKTYAKYKKAVLEIDGYGHVLAIYDGKELEVMGYYIYRVN